MRNNWTESSIQKLGELLHAEKTDDAKTPYVFHPKDKKLRARAICIDLQCKEILRDIGICSGPKLLNQYGLMRKDFQTLADK